MSKGIPIQLPRGYEGYSKAPKESPLAMVTRGAVLRALKGTAVPDFAASIPPAFSSASFNPREPEAQAMAEGLWDQFVRYMVIRRVEGKGTLELSAEGRGPYPLNLPEDQPASVSIQALQKRQQARLFTVAESLIQKKGNQGELDMTAVQIVASQQESKELSATEMAAAFSLAFAYPGSQARGVIDEHRERLGVQGEPPRPKTPPPAHGGEGVAIAA